MHEVFSADTRLGQAFAPLEAQHPGQSGVAILERGPLAWLSRATLADVAERSIDAQYYIYSSDQTGLILLERLKAAADRGVHVRLLIDDNNVAGRDVQLASLDRHPNIEIRVFNPSLLRAPWMRGLRYFTELSRANRRMHNKIYVVDGEVAIVGGRNIGDNYFSFGVHENFTDLDLLVAGPAARSLAASFDAYWNSPWAYSAQALVSEPPTDADTARVIKAIDAYARQDEHYLADYADAKSDYLDSLLRSQDSLDWAEVEVVSDPPDKVDPDLTAETVGNRPRSRVAARIARAWADTEQELLIESAYFVPRAAGLASFAALRKRGVAVTVVTNSLSSTDVPAVHAGYRKRRRPLLEMGVELYEFERMPLPNQAVRRRLRDREHRGWLAGRPQSAASLHSKVMIFDRTSAWVGSFNIDPRSHSLNTEVGLMVHSPVVARRLAELVEGDLAPDRSWHVQLEPKASGGSRIVWTGVRNGVEVHEHSEPDTTWELRAWTTFLAKLPGLDAFL